MFESIDKTRREFIKTCLRYGVGGGIIFAGIVLGSRKKTDDNDSDQCLLNSPCQGCSQYYGCNLPKAFMAREENGMKGGNRDR